MKASSKRNHFDVWARFSYRYLTAVRGMSHVDDRLPFCNKLQRKGVETLDSASNYRVYRIKQCLAPTRYVRSTVKQAVSVGDLYHIRGTVKL